MRKPRLRGPSGKPGSAGVIVGAVNGPLLPRSESVSAWAGEREACAPRAAAPAPAAPTRSSVRRERDVMGILFIEWSAAKQPVPIGT